MISVPASSANLGPGFDALALALSLRARFGPGQPVDGARRVEDHHPAMVAFRAAGGEGALWEQSSIPMGRGLGYSAAVRVGGAAVAVARRHGIHPGQEFSETERAEVFEVASRLEGHADNAAASVYGGVVVTAAGRVVKLPMTLAAEIVMWIPSTSTSTNRSRTRLPSSVAFEAASFNLGRSALLVAALVTGRTELLREATADQLHQTARMGQIDGASELLERGLELGAWGGWLSGSGPSVALICEPASGVSPALSQWALSAGLGGSVRVMSIDPDGVLAATA